MAIEKGIYNINGVDRMVLYDFENESLAMVLRRIGLTSVKVGCEAGQCGICTVLLDGKPVRACIKKFKSVPEFSKIETLEGLGTAGNLHPLQLAWIKYGGVQCGYCTPGFIMSAKGLLDVNPKPTRSDVKDWFTKNNNLCRCTGYKPLVDAVMAAAEVIRGEKPKESLLFDMPEDGRVFGTRYPRPAALGRVLGVTDFGRDIDNKMPPGTLHMAIKWADHLHAKILSIDTSEAEAMPGVVKVLTARDIQGTNDISFPLTHPRSRAKTNLHPILCDKKVTRAGDAIAIIIADTRENARTAAKLVKVEYELLPVYKSYLEACVPGAAPVEQNNPTPFVYQPIIKGEPTAPIFDKAADPNSDVVVVEGSFSSSRQPHLSLENESAQAFYDEDGVLTIVYKTQAVYFLIAKIPRAIGIDPDKLHVVASPSGASFGAAMDITTPALVCAAALAVQKPVTFTSSFEEKQRMTGKRSASFANSRLACDRSGRILAHEFDLALDVGAIGGGFFAPVSKASRFSLAPYNVPNVRGLVRAGFSNNAHTMAYRGFGSPQPYTSGEQLIDMMAEKLGIDPFEIRYRNVARPGDLTINSYPFYLYPLADMMDQIRSDYEDARKWKKESAAPGWKRGVGISVGGYHVGFPTDNCEVALELCAGDIIRCYNTWEDQGQGADIGTIANTHEALKPLGITPDKISLVLNDSKVCPNSGPAAGSRCNYMIGMATIEAANKLMDAMRKEDGTYRTYEEMVAEGIPTLYKGIHSIPIEEVFHPHPDTGTGNPMADQNFIINIARIEVEESTGKVKVVAVHSIADVGKIANYLSMDGQAYSGLMHALGFALSEDYYDNQKKYGTLLGCGFLRCNEVPDDMTFDYHETPREGGPFGTGGAAECFQSSCHVCVLNAINDAVGVRIHEIPALPEKVKAAIDAKKAGMDYAPQKYYLGDDFEDVLDDIIANPVGRSAANKEEFSH